MRYFVYAILISFLGLVAVGCPGFPCETNDDCINPEMNSCIDGLCAARSEAGGPCDEISYPEGDNHDCTDEYGMCTYVEYDCWGTILELPRFLCVCDPL